MKAAIAVIALASLTTACGMRSTGTECTNAPQTEWQNQDTFQQNLLDQGYKINKFVVTGGNCYEIYGFNKEGQKVEIYFNPVTGEVVKEEIE